MSNELQGVGMKLRVRLRVGLAVTVGVLLVSVPVVAGTPFDPVLPASASVACSSGGSFSNYFDGQQYSQANATLGTAAKLVTRPATLCTGDPIYQNFSSAWTMISGSGSGEWAQAGIWHDPVNNAGAYVFFAQYNNGGAVSGKCVSPCVNRFGAVTNNGQVHQYWEQYLSSGQEALNVDLTNFLTTPFNISSAWVQPFNNQFFGEVGNFATDQPGNPADGVETFTQMQWQETNPGHPWSGYDTPFYGVPLGNDQNPLRWTYDGIVDHGGTEGNAFDIWTYYEYTP
jgi:hypothetical protein